ncbi:MAG: type ISP restriction/modification enzyme [Thermodesulfobacteriota bacterium]
MSKKKLAKVYYADLWGLREGKYEYLFKNDIQTTRWQELEPVAPYYFFVPKDFALQAEYEKFWKVTDIFKEFQIGLMTGQDEFFIDSNPQALKARILAIFNKNLNDETLKNLYNLKSQAGRKTIKARNLTIFKQELICLFCYRPFDIQYVYAENKFLWRSVEALKKHFIVNNIALITTRILAKPPFNHVFIAQHPGDNTLISGQTKERNYFFPLYLYPNEPVGTDYNLSIYINKDQYFEGIPIEVWEYRIGAYQVMEKYLKDRKGRKLSLDEINHYMKVAKAIRLTIILQEKIDEVYRESKN